MTIVNSKCIFEDSKSWCSSEDADTQYRIFVTGKQRSQTDLAEYIQIVTVVRSENIIKYS